MHFFFFAGQGINKILPTFPLLWWEFLAKTWAAINLIKRWLFGFFFCFIAMPKIIFWPKQRRLHIYNLALYANPFFLLKEFVSAIFKNTNWLFVQKLTFLDQSYMKQQSPFLWQNAGNNRKWRLRTFLIGSTKPWKFFNNSTLMWIRRYHWKKERNCWTDFS